MKETSQLKLGKSVIGNPVPAFVNVRLYNKMQNKFQKVMCDKRMYSIFKGFIICGIKMLYDISTAKDFNC